MIFLQTAVNPIYQFGPMLLIMVVFFFFFMRPQMRKQKAQEEFVNNLAKGKEVVTNSGIVGRILSIEGNVVTLVVDGKNTIRILKGFISKELTEAIGKNTTSTPAVSENA